MHSPPQSPLPSPTTISDPARTLLVVDDDPVVRQSLAEVLGRQGYQVLQAENPAEAMWVASAPDTMHLLLTDFSMPKGKGLDLSLEFLQLRPKDPGVAAIGLNAANSGRQHCPVELMGVSEVGADRHLQNVPGASAGGPRNDHPAWDHRLGHDVWRSTHRTLDSSAHPPDCSSNSDG